MDKRSADARRQKLRIMPMGDSITEGVGSPGGYRLPLYDALTGKGYDVDFVGSKCTNLKVIIGTIPTFTNAWNHQTLRDPISSAMVDQVSRHNERIRSIGLQLVDGLHPNPQGYQAMAQTWLGGIEQVLG
ncbi:MAG: hypothetical protein ACKOYH_08700 [Cyanobium sp.]